jgi:predicted ribosome quality control (RQC) complex YloA/Tae2 family protein
MTSDRDHLPGAPPSPAERLTHWSRLCRQAVQRLRRKLDRQREELAQAADHAHLQQCGDSLLAEPAAVKRGASEWVGTNVHTGQAETIKLNPKLDAHGNAELYYKKARKSRRGLGIIRELVAGTQAQLAALDRLVADLTALGGAAEADLAAALPGIGNRMAALRLVPAGPGAEPQRAPAPQVPYRHIHCRDTDIYVGKNDAQNDELTVHFARPWDIWLHVAAQPGSHVLVRREKSAPWPSADVIAIAAGLAVWFSKAKHTSWSEVHVAEKRYVSKRRHAPAGEVVLQQYRTVRAAPLSPQDLFRRHAGAEAESHGVDD